MKVQRHPFYASIESPILYERHALELRLLEVKVSVA